MGNGEALNGAIVSSCSLDGWFIVGDGMRFYIGKALGWLDGPQAGMLRLSPAYNYVENWQISPNGAVGRMRVVLPLEYLASLEELELRPTTSISLGSLDEADTREVRKLISNAEDIRKRLVAQRSGIQLATAMPAPRKQ